ncbi:hypothetical protein HB662_14895 [Roseomonas frigidaquae]|uniref:Uncharacterized protein n=1 Tax=Falsiroseomonas frigidaquae TaxID=487318 RepID=A0ABX1F197_9PROT|nr:hypothetical protein [Falsiroseomonas frigidaquae]NKE46072.1 hypothetical protein [Falsiroseomonas frigidaquae]
MDAYPAHFFSGFALLVLATGAASGWADTKGGSFLRRMFGATKGIDLAVFVCAVLAGVAVVGGLLGIGTGCAPHRPIDC